MDDHSITVLEELFERASDLPMSERSVYLEAACHGEQSLRDAVEALLQTDAIMGQDDGYLRGPVLEARNAAADASATLRIDGYRILRKIGDGGMGSVYEAEQENPRRRVAIKVIRPGLASRDVVKRFNLEAQVLGRLRHPGIAQVHEAGVAADGQPFIAMEFISGLPLLEFARRNFLDDDARIDLLALVCDAVEYAHLQGVIHRDLKPANILVDDNGQPRVLDFGVARATDVDLQITLAQTQAGQLIGTLAYMSPEQFAGDPTRIDHRADVYALGVILFELLANRTPFNLHNLALPEVARVICEREPPALGKVSRVFEGDVETIVAKALRKDAANRYASAQQLGADLRRYRCGEPIEARPVSNLERFARWARLHRGLAASLAVIALMLVATTVGSTVAAFWFQDSAERNARLANEKDDARKKAELASKAERYARYRANIATAASSLQTHNISTAKSALDAAPEEHRNWEWHYFHNQLDTARLTVKAPVSIRNPVLSADGRRVAAAANASFLRDTLPPDVYVWEIETGKLLHWIRAPDGATRNAIRPDCLQAARDTADGRVQLVDLTSGKITSELNAHQGKIAALAYGRNGKFLATAGKDRTACVWEVETGRKVAALTNLDGEPISIVPSPNGKRLLVLTTEISLWDLERSERLATLAATASWRIVHNFSPDGRHVLVGQEYPTKMAFVYDADTGKKVTELSGHQNIVPAGDIRPDGSRIATGSLDQTLRLWDASTGKTIAVMRGHTGWVVRTAFSPDGQRLASVAEDGNVRIWDAHNGELIDVLHGHMSATLFDLTWSSDSSRIAVASSDGALRLWDVASHAQRNVLRGHTGYVYDVTCRPDGAQLASAAWDGTVRLWDLTTHQQTTVLRHENDIVTNVAYVANGPKLVSFSRHSRTTVWNPDRAKRLYTLKLPSEDAKPDARVAVDSKGLRGVIGTYDGLIRLWDIDTGQFFATFASGAAWVADVAFSPDNTRMAASLSDSSVGLWNVERRECVHRLRGHAEIVNRVVFDKPGRRLATASLDHTARVWDVETGRELFPPFVHADKVWCAAFSPDGTRLATACNDNTIRLWDLATGQEVAELRGHDSYVKSITFSPDGTRLFSASGDFTIRIWDTLPPRHRRGEARGQGSP